MMPTLRDRRAALGGERRDEVAEAAAQVGHLDVGAVQLRRARDDRGVLEVALAERGTAGPPRHSLCTSMSAPISTSASTKPKRLLVDGLVHDRDALRLRERDDERLLPVGHEAGVHVGLDDDRLELAAGVEEADAVLVRSSKSPPTLRKTLRNVSISAWRGAADEDVAVGRERGGGPARGLVAVEERAVVVAVRACRRPRCG